MNKKEIAEIRRRFNPEKNNIAVIRGCYVNERREIVSDLFESPLSLPREACEKYMQIFKRALSGVPGKNLVDVVFRPDQVMEGEEHALLSALRETQLRDEARVQAFFRRVIDSLKIEGSYLILLAHDTYDVPGKGRAAFIADEASEEVFRYILCAVCPVKPGKPALRYIPQENEFRAGELDRVVGAPELGFLFPAFDDRAANLYNALFYTRDAAQSHAELISALFAQEPPMSAAAQREAFQAVLEESLAEELSYSVAQAVHDELVARIEEKKGDREAEAPTVSKGEIASVLAACGVAEERVLEFGRRYDEEFGKGMDLGAGNIVDARQFEVRTPDVVIRVPAEKSDLVEARVIDGTRYILVRADEGAEVNGVNVRI